MGIIQISTGCRFFYEHSVGRIDYFLGGVTFGGMRRCEMHPFVWNLILRLEKDLRERYRLVGYLDSFEVLLGRIGPSVYSTGRASGLGPGSSRSRTKYEPV